MLSGAWYGCAELKNSFNNEIRRSEVMGVKMFVFNSLFS